VSLVAQTEQIEPMTPQEFRGLLFGARTKRDLYDLLFRAGHERGLFSDMTDEERQRYLERRCAA